MKNRYLHYARSVLISGLSCLPIVSFAQTKVVVIPLDSTPPIVANQFRIVPELDIEGDGLQAGDGRLEVRIGNAINLETNDYLYGTVCDDDFDNNDNAANAICQDLGFAGGVLRDNDRITDGATGTPIALDDIDCPADATSFAQCTAQPIFEHNCDHTEDVGVTCF